MLPGQNFRGGHQGRLAAVFRREVDAGGGHHGLAGAHVPLAEPVHGKARAHVTQGLADGAALGPRQGEGEGGVEGRHVHRTHGGHGDSAPPGPEPGKAQGEEEELLKGQPPPGQAQGLVPLRKVDVLHSVGGGAEGILLPDGGGQLRHGVAAGVQGLPDGPGEKELAEPRRQGIDGHDAARPLPQALPLHDGAGHGLAEKAALRPAVKEIGLPHLETVLQPALVEEGQVQHPSLVHRPDLHEVHPFSDVGKGWGGGDHGGHAGALAGDELGNFLRLPPVIVGPGVEAQQVPQGPDVQPFQHLRLLGPDAPQDRHRAHQGLHAAASLPEWGLPLGAAPVVN